MYFGKDVRNMGCLVAYDLWAYVPYIVKRAYFNFIYLFLLSKLYVVAIGRLPLGWGLESATVCASLIVYRKILQPLNIVVNINEFIAGLPC